MKLGICLPHYGRPIEVERMLEVARRAEDRLDSVWVTDHVIVPERAYRHLSGGHAGSAGRPAVARRRDARGRARDQRGHPALSLADPGGEAPGQRRCLSGGRLIVGAAIGWLEGEFEALGVPFRERASRSDEALELMRTLWTQEHPKIQTKRHRVQDVVVSPMPLQKPRPPLYIGGNSEAAFRRVARLGDGWHASSMNQEAFRQGADAVRRLWKEGRTRGRAVPVAPHSDPDRRRAPAGGRHGSDPRPRPSPLHGSAKQIAEELRRLPGARLWPRRAGGLILHVPGDSRRHRPDRGDAVAACGLSAPRLELATPTRRCSRSRRGP